MFRNTAALYYTYRETNGTLDLHEVLLSFPKINILLSWVLYCISNSRGWW